MHYLGIIGSGVAFVGFLIYIVSILKGETKPSRSTWWILALVMALTIASSLSINARENIWIQCVYFVTYIIVASLSLSPKYGYGARLENIDKVCLIGALMCGALWVVFNSPLAAFLGSIVIDFIGLFPTMKKAWQDAGSESIVAWSIGTTGILLNALGVSHWFTTGDLSWVYAAYLLLTNALITFFVIVHRSKSKERIMVK